MWEEPSQTLRKEERNESFVLGQPKFLTLVKQLFVHDHGMILQKALTFTFTIIIANIEGVDGLAKKMCRMKAGFGTKLFGRQP